MNYIKIKAELDGNALLYAALTDRQATNELNVVDKVVQVDSYSGSELFRYTNITEYNLLNPTKKDEWLSLCNIENLSFNVVLIVDSIFGSASTTLSNVPVSKTLSRAAVLGLGVVRVNEVAIARAN